MSHLVDNHIEHICSIGPMVGSPDASPGEKHIRQSWIRCVKEYDLDPAHPCAVVVTESVDLLRRQEAVAEVLPIAKIEMKVLYEQHGSCGCAVLFTDIDGVVLHCVTGADFDLVASKSGLRGGAVWTERLQGTNGIGTCLQERQPLTVQRKEHFLSRNAGLTCAAAPILDPHGDLLGVLNVSSGFNHARQHMLALAWISTEGY